MFNPDTNRWLKVGNTSILMKLDTSYAIPEWHIVGHIVFRKIYTDLPAKWYAFVQFSEQDVRLYDELSEAREYLESLLP